MTAVFIVILAGTIYLVRRPEPSPITISTLAPHATPTASAVTVQMCGAVANPGVYTLTEGSRVQDAIKIAGNVLSNGDVGALNLARKLNDGEQICIPTTNEVSISAPPTGAAITPKPTSACIAYKDANAHIGETTCVRGTVTGTGKSGTTFFINFDESFDSFYAVSFDHTWDNLPGRCVEIRGKLTVFRGKPQIILDNENQLSFCK